MKRYHMPKSMEKVMHQTSDGRYVLFEDYDRLRKLADKMVEAIRDYQIEEESNYRFSKMDVIQDEYRKEFPEGVK